MRPDLKPSRIAIAAARPALRSARVACFPVTRQAAEPFPIPL
jgi:hypothetical protein